DSGRTRGQFLGLLRSPARAVRRFDKPAHHKSSTTTKARPSQKFAHHKSLLTSEVRSSKTG
ncbi:hypothetical protein, partial [Pseudomonas marginalis]|uniref:hypothetical protein n=1 Tax=Pseudomonas marginalis TaxID=298 RepID=UPI001C8392E6